MLVISVIISSDELFKFHSNFNPQQLQFFRHKILMNAITFIIFSS